MEGRGRSLAVATALGGAMVAARIAALSRRQRQVALHDPLTKLPNRSLFLDRTTHALASARRMGTWTAVLFLDLDDFKRVNDAFGHSTGDALLREIAIRISSVVRPSDTVSRFGGDEFTILCPGLDSAEDAVQVAQRVIAELERPFVIGGRELRAAASVGIAFAPAGGSDADALVRDADAAMYRAKDHGRGGYEVFDEAVRERVMARLRMEAALRHALDAGELALAYQPFLAFDEQRVLGFEALLRWQSPELGMVAPADFIPIAEQSGLMQRIGAWVLHEACGQIRRLRMLRPELNLFVAVNLSARQINDPELPRIVAQALDQHGLPASALALEITEADLVENPGGVRESLEALRGLGVRLMLDDFGTGFSSLGYLKRLPVDTLKIDRSFVAGLGHDDGDRAIVAAIMGIARALELEVVAEGVETAGQAAELAALGCTVAQGFRYGEPTYEPAATLAGPAVTQLAAAHRN